MTTDGERNVRQPDVTVLRDRPCAGTRRCGRAKE